MFVDLIIVEVLKGIVNSDYKIIRMSNIYIVTSFYLRGEVMSWRKNINIEGLLKAKKTIPVQEAINFLYEKIVKLEKQIVTKKEKK